MHSGAVAYSRRQALLRDTVLPVLKSSKVKGTPIDPNHGQTVTGVKGDIRQICHLAAVFEPPSGPKHTWYGDFDFNVTLGHIIYIYIYCGVSPLYTAPLHAHF